MMTRPQPLRVDAPSEGTPASPQVTIVVPVFNAAQHLAQCVNSVLAQTLQDFEAVLVNDGSTDGSADLCDAFARADTRVRVIHLQQGGPSRARSIGVAESRGEYVTFLDADDWLEPIAFERYVRDAQVHQADVVMGGYFADHVSASTGALKRRDPVVPRAEQLSPGCGALQASLQFLNDLGYVWNKLYHRSLLSDRTFPPDARICEDAIFNSGVLRAATRMVTSPTALVHYRQIDGVISQGRIDFENFLTLRFQAIAGMVDLLRYWGASERDARRIELAARVLAVYSKLLLTWRDSSDAYDFEESCGRILEDARVRSALRAAYQTRQLQLRRRFVALILGVLPARLSTMLATALWRGSRYASHRGASSPSSSTKSSESPALRAAPNPTKEI